jgi:hypothetical protein
MIRHVDNMKLDRISLSRSSAAKEGLKETTWIEDRNRDMKMHIQVETKTTTTLTATYTMKNAANCKSPTKPLILSGRGGRSGVESEIIIDYLDYLDYLDFLFLKEILIHPVHGLLNQATYI